jgi:FlaA1/EpsC-like NDP-sugar epimerase
LLRLQWRCRAQSNVAWFSLLTLGCVCCPFGWCFICVREFLFRWQDRYWPVTPSALLAFPIFITSGLYRAIFRYSGLPAMMAVARSMLLYAVAFAAIFTFWGVDGVQRKIGLNSRSRKIQIQANCA